MITEFMFYIHLVSIGFLSTLIAIVVFRPIAIRLKLIDYPDQRKRHKGEIPLIGGICIFVGVLLSLIYINEVDFIIYKILISTFFILILGIYDDLVNIRPEIKLFIQLFIVAITVYLSGIKIETLGFLLGLPYVLDLGLSAIPFTIISVIGLMNAFNMIDGLDGQAGILSAIAILGILIFGLDHVGLDLLKILLTILSGLIAFLIFNISSNNKMKIFLGDGGSLFLGCIISFSLIYCTQILKLFSPSFALWCVTIPLFDFFSVIILRKIEKQNPLKANRDHIHNFLESFNFSKKSITLITSACGLVFLCLGYYLERNLPSLSFLIFMILFITYLILRIFCKRKIKTEIEDL